MLIPVCGERLPVKLECVIISAKNLPVMNKSINSTDAFVEVKLADVEEKTDVVTSLNPTWIHEPFIFDTDEKALTTEIIQFKVFDHDTYSANDAIGRVHFDCNIIIEKMRLKDKKHIEEIFTLPIYDTLNGIRGDLSFKLSIQLLIDYDYKNYVQILTGGQIPGSLKLNEMIGLLYEIKTEKDPDYEWLDKIRSPRATNLARQNAIRSAMRAAAMSIAYKAEKHQSNLILGYNEHVDIEGSATDFITIRVYGTALKVSPVDAMIAPVGEVSHFPLLSIGCSLHSKQVGFGSIVSARAVKILEDVEEPEQQRKVWWNELRSELHQQCLALNCDLIIGYTEHVALHEGVMLIGCVGTAVLTSQTPTFFLAGPRGSSGESDVSQTKELSRFKKFSSRARGETANSKIPCENFHTSMLEGKTTFSVKTQKCNICKKYDVPDLYISSAPVPPHSICYGPRNFVQVSHTKKITSEPQNTEEYAHELSNTLPFADNDLFEALIGEMKNVSSHGNALFDTQFKYAISDDLLVCVVTGVMVRLQCSGKEESSSPSLSNVLSFSTLQKTYDARRFSWGHVKEAIRFKQPNVSNVTTKVLPIKSPAIESLDDSGGMRRSRLNTIVGRLKKRQHEKEYMIHVVSERNMSLNIGILEYSSAGNSALIAGIHLSPALNALVMNRETSEAYPVIARYSDVFVREDLNNSVKDSPSVDAFIASTLEEIIAQVRAIATVIGQCSVSHLRLASSQFTISKEHAHIIIHISCDIYSTEY